MFSFNFICMINSSFYFVKYLCSVYNAENVGVNGISETLIFLNSEFCNPFCNFVLR